MSSRSGSGWSAARLFKSKDKTSSPSSAASDSDRFFPRNEHKQSSTRSRASSHSSASTATNHPYAMHNPPSAIVSSHDLTDDERECPVCLESLSFSFRLPGEKPHVVPECGHALHEACFTAVYGPPPGSVRGGMPRKSNLGVCGVCRRPMKVGDGDGGKLNKLAALTGMGERGADRLYPGAGANPQGTMNGRPGTMQKPFDPTDDDALEYNGSIRSGAFDQNSSQYVVSPSISVRSEFASITRTNAPVQPLTCIVMVELPSRRANDPSSNSDPYRGQPPTPLSTRSGPMGDMMSPTGSRRESPDPSLAPKRSQKTSSTESNPSYYPPHPNGESPFQSITDDLNARITDWKGHPMSGLGPLQMFDILSVRRDLLVREFYVYLFREAIICVLEEKKKSLGRLLSSASGGSSAYGDPTGSQTGSQNQKGILRLKGRIYIRHIKRVHDTSSAGELSLTIDMEDERLESFILIFRDRATLESWRGQIAQLVSSFQHANGRAPSSNGGAHGNGLDGMEEFGSPPAMPKNISAKAQRMLSGGTTGSEGSNVDSILNGSNRSMGTSNTSAYGYHNGPQGRLPKIPSEEHLVGYTQADIRTVTPHLAGGGSNSLNPIQHAPLDIILVISVPPPNAPIATAALKVRVIKTTLDFVIAQLGARDRLSLVTFEVGPGGRVRKTPFLCPARGGSRKRLESFIERIAVPGHSSQSYDHEDATDEFLVRTTGPGGQPTPGAGDEKTDVVTAVNHGLDVVLQRKAKNSVTGMILVSDAAESTRRAQMDLVLARTEAAAVPIHSFGYGRSHDPASLWLISNHTSGTYTFVKDWYDLRDCLAGCLGGLMSIGLLNLKTHLKVVDSNRFRIRKCSGGSAIVGSDGREVHLEVGELRYGEKKEILVELELDNNMDMMRMGAAHGAMNGHGGNRTLNATDEFVARMGLDSLSLDDGANLMDGMMERMIDEVPVFEVDGSFYDPNASKQVSRLAHPILLTVTLLPPARDPNQQSQTPASDPVIVRRRMELLASDMMTRALVLVSRKNYPQAQRVLSETKRILHTVLQNITQSLPPPSAHGSTVRNRKEILTLGAVRVIQAVLQDIQLLLDALDENVELFVHDQRNFGAQQSMILRDQKSWSGRTATEKVFWTVDNSLELVARSADWVARD